MLEVVLRNKRVYLATLMVGGFFFLSGMWLILPPTSFPSESIVTIPEGSGLYTLAEKLEREHVIRSPFWFRVSAIMLGGERRMMAGDYYMSRPQHVFTIAWRVFHGKHDIETVKLTIPEGFTKAKIDKLFDHRFKYFNHAQFLNLAPEGYLFPDTYFVPVTAIASSTIKLMRENFNNRISTLTQEIEESGKSLRDIVTMASLIEGEANNQLDREMVSDVLWKRLKIGMPLQVDVEKTTYEFQGLPENPINNPGLLSIQAAIHPTTTPYLYYLTGDDGNMYYSKTFEEHVAKKVKYIK